MCNVGENIYLCVPNSGKYQLLQNKIQFIDWNVWCLKLIIRNLHIVPGILHSPVQQTKSNQCGPHKHTVLQYIKLYSSKTLIILMISYESHNIQGSQMSRNFSFRFFLFVSSQSVPATFVFKIGKLLIIVKVHVSIVHRSLSHIRIDDVLSLSRMIVMGSYLYIVWGVIGCYRM